MHQYTGAQNQQPVLAPDEIEAEPSSSYDEQEQEAVTEQSATEGAKDQTSYQLVKVRKKRTCEQYPQVDSTACGGDPRLDPLQPDPCCRNKVTSLLRSLVRMTAKETIQEHSRTEGDSCMSKRQHFAR